ncbi:MAG: hypothetical protein Q7S96_02020 [bacterium]|nr:hypothetical protein [bacterium]
MQTFRDALVAAGHVTPQDARRVKKVQERSEAEAQQQKHRDLASREQDSQMSDDDIAREILARAGEQ